MKIKKNILNYKDPNTGEYTSIPVIVSDVNEEIRKEVTELNEKLVQYVKSVNGFEPNEEGAVQIRYPADSDEAYDHEELSNGLKKITIYKNDDYTNQPQIIFGKNYYPVTKNKSSYVKVLNDNHNITVTGTHTATLSLPLTPLGSDEEYVPVSEDFVSGERLTLCVYGQATDGEFPNVKFEMFDSNKNFIKQLTAKIQAGETFATQANIIFPDNVAYMRFSLTIYANTTYNHTFFPVLIKANSTIENVTFVDDEATTETNNPTTVICTAPYKSIVNYDFDLKKYIDRKSEQKNDDNPFKGGILTPEMFGAYADGLHDDTEALQNCINEAISNNKKVIGGGEYITSSPIIIKGNSVSCDIKKITYTGDDCAVILSGQFCAISINYIGASSAVGFRLNGSEDGAENSYNEIYLGRVNAGKNAVEYISSMYDIVSNNLTFGALRSGAQYNCIYHTSWKLDTVNHGNNNFTGGLLERGLWGVYNAKALDTYMTCRFEGVTNCIHQDCGGAVRVIAPRYAEIVNNTTKDGRFVFYEVSNVPYDVIPSGTGASPYLYITLDGSGIPLNTYSIDVSGAPTLMERSIGGELTVTPINKTTPGVGIIRERLRRLSGGNMVANSFMLFGKHILIPEPASKMTKHVTTSDSGYVGDYRTTGNEDEFYIYDTYIVDENGCEYTLPPSYDNIAFNHFMIIQSEGSSCTFKDWRGTPIFNGAEYGTGAYDVRITTDNPLHLGDYDNNHQIWEIRRMSDYSLVDIMPHERPWE